MIEDSLQYLFVDGMLSFELSDSILYILIYYFLVEL